MEAPLRPPTASRRFLPPRRGRIAGLLVLALVLLMRAALRTPEPPADSPAAQQPLPAGTYRVERVVDGDTLLLAGGDRVRLIGIDTPETVKPDHPIEPWGAAAADFTRQFVAQGGGSVRLEFDRERFDIHGRRLAYVWDGERMLNEALLSEGLARFEPQFHYSETVKRRFRRAEDEARRAGRGLWSAPPGEASDSATDEHDP